MKKKRLAKEDGYIKNQTVRLKREKIAIIYKIFIIVVPVVFFMIFITLLMYSAPPEKWSHEKIIFSTVYRERYHTRRGVGYKYILETTGGEKYLISRKEMDILSQKLVSNEQYNIVYCKELFYKKLKSISSDDEEFVKLENSIAKRNSNLKELRIALIVMSCLLVIGIVLVYCLWCKGEREEIKRINQKISIRLKKNEERNKRKKSQCNNEML